MNKEDTYEEKSEEALKIPSCESIRSYAEDAEEEFTESIFESSDDSISSETGIRCATERIQQLSSVGEAVESGEKFYKIMKHSYRILSYFSRKHGETSSKIHEHYLNYAKSFFKLLRWNLEQGLDDETENAFVRDDWEVVVECFQRAIACAERGINHESFTNIEPDKELSTIESALKHLTCVYVYRENPREALNTAELLYRRFPTTANAIILAETHVLNEHFSSAKSLIAEIHGKVSNLELTNEETMKVEELHELLFQNDPTKIKWDVHKFIQKEHQIHKHMKNAAGNIVTHFEVTGPPTKKAKDTYQVSTNVITARRK